MTPQKTRNITVFEHDRLMVGDCVDGVCFDEDWWHGLEKHCGKEGVPYFELIAHGVRFNEFVGVIQVDGRVIEVLPKIDRQLRSKEEKKLWRNLLIGMLQAVDYLDLESPGYSRLTLKPNSILDLYIAIFLKEVDYLLHGGLVKQYRQDEENLFSLKGSLRWEKHLRQNMVHKERFYVQHTVYDVHHKLNAILHKTLRLLKRINTNASLHSSIGSLLLHFPEMADLAVDESTFEKIRLNRKTRRYQPALNIARLLLLQYHPDLSRGKHDVLALMFDMNELWEKFVYVSLRKYGQSAFSVTAQASKWFWQPAAGKRSAIRPDIVLNKGNDNCVVLDTKWKDLKGANPSPEDLRQMYVYHDYYDAKKVALVYPGTEMKIGSGSFLRPDNASISQKECAVISVAVSDVVKDWQKQIAALLKTWIN